MANQSWRGGGGVATTNFRESSPVLKPTELNREGSFASQVDNILPLRQNSNETQQAIPSSPPNIIPLSSYPVHSQAPHAATAAEIALGIPSPYQTRHENSRAEQAMVHDSRYLRRVRPGDEQKSTDISSVITSFSEVKDRDEENTSRTSDTGLVTSPGRMTPLNDSLDEGTTSDNPRISGMTIGTPSTVSTCPSTDDASLGTDYRLDDSSHLPNLLPGSPGHHRSSSWGEERLLPDVGDNPFFSQMPDAPWTHGATHHFHNTPQQPWRLEQHRVATFREPQNNNATYHDHSWTPPQYMGHQQRRYDHSGEAQSHSETRQQPQNSQQRHVLSATPPRPRNSRQPGPPAPSRQQTQSSGHASNPHQSPSSNQRAPSEVLKTLLRKKACLYEPDTSRSVALVTWLVGKELAMEFGFFSRQQLQSGVHACVADKIESGTITRTKVNRCMQIILNSCFHYIIPRSDGSEENGDAFRNTFAASVQDDSFLLQYLPRPWHDLHTDRQFILEACLSDDEDKGYPSSKSPSTPKSSPRLSSREAPRSPGRDSRDGDDHDSSKRAVLLCFNENVRSAEDVFRCHNEFIRDTANAAHLQLTAQEWRSFFGRDAANAPYLWGNVGIPVASDVNQRDTLGRLSADEVLKFRTSWCAKRYEHDHELCGFGHIEVSNGWLRRNPAIYNYEDKMCPHVFSTTDKRVTPNPFIVNECPHGVNCDKAHSIEEIIYHPRRYKTKNCTAAVTRSGWCRMGDVCPHMHSADSSKASRKPGDRSRYSKKNDPNTGTKSAPATLPGSPVLYASPAPFSAYERHLGMPGLQSLFRRHSTVIRAHFRCGGKCVCHYTCFGDDLGVSVATNEPLALHGLPSPMKIHEDFPQSSDVKLPQD